MNRLLLALCMLPACGAFAQQDPAPAYPRMVGYASVLHPIASFDENGSHFNFSDSYTVAFPMGLNLLKSDKAGFSFEIAPFIRAQGGTDKVSSILFHPGAMFRYPKGFTFILRAAFETNGRYGFTPVFNKVVVRAKTVNYFVAVGLPARFGNDTPSSFGTALQLGVSF